MKRIAIACLLMFAALFGCATTPQTPAQAVYAAHGTYTVALTAAVKYAELPRCGQPTSPPLCARPEAIAQLQKADDVAYTALLAAQGIVRSRKTGDAGIPPTVENAIRAVNAFAQIANQLGGR